MDIKRLVCKISEWYSSWNNMAFHCLSSCSDWIFISQQSWVVICRNAGSSPQAEFLNWFGTVKVKTQLPQVMHVWWRGSFPGRARGVTPATRPPNIQWSGVQQFDLDKCLWWFPEWVRSTVDTTLCPSERCSTHLYRGPQGEQWSATFRQQLKSTECFPTVFCGNYNTAGGGDWG